MGVGEAGKECWTLVVSQAQQVDEKLELASFKS